MAVDQGNCSSLRMAHSGWRDGSAAKSTLGSRRGSRLCFPPPHGAHNCLMIRCLLLASVGTCTHTVHRYTRRQKRLYTQHKNKYVFKKPVHFQHRKTVLCEQVPQRAFPELVLWVRFGPSDFNQRNLQKLLGGAETV